MREILRIEELEKEYESGIKIGKLSFEIYEGEFISLIGESGCGKSTIARLLTERLERDSGKIYYRGNNLESMLPQEKKNLKTKIQMIFQSPYSSLNPKYTVKEIVEEGIKYHTIVPKEEQEEYVKNLIQEVGLGEEVLEKYPKQLSGGECQRVGIARALSVKPEVIIADECLSSLDAITQYQILTLFEKIKQERKISCLFISHDIFVVKKISDRVLIMKSGQIVEQGTKEEVFQQAKNSYTKSLLKASLEFTKEVV